MISFSILLFVTGVVVFLLLASLCQSDNSITKVANKVLNLEDTQSDKLVQYDELLHARLNSLHRLDEQYASLLINGANLKSLDSLNVIIHQEEEYFSAVVNSINQNITLFAGESKRNQFVKMIASFRSAITYRAAINSLRNEIAFKSEDLEPGTGQLQQLEDELEERNSRISILENSVKVLKKAKAPLGKQPKNQNNVLGKVNIKIEKKTAVLVSVNNKPNK